MNRIKSIISIALLAIFLLPTAEKLSHELGHHHEDECHENDTHFCASEHGCEICSFTYSAFTPVASTDVQEPNHIIEKPVVQHYVSANRFELRTIFQRGPPSIA